MKSKVFYSISNFMNTKYFIMLVSILTFILYAFNAIEVACFFYCICIILGLVTNANFSSGLSVIFLSIATTQDDAEIKYNTPYIILMSLLYVPIAILLVIKLITNRKEYFGMVKHNPLLYIMLITLLIMALSCVNSPSLKYFGLGIGHYAITVGVFFVGLLFIKTDKKTIDNLIFSIICLALVATAEYAYRFLELLHKGTMFELIVISKLTEVGWLHPNHLAIIVNVGMLASLYYFIVAKNFKDKIFGFISFWILLTACVIMLCRGGYFALIVTLPLMVAFYIYYIKNHRMQIYNDYIYLYISIAIALVALVVLKNNGSFNLILDMFKDRGASLSGRSEIYKIAIDNLKNHFFIGTGVYSSRYYIELNYPDNAVYNYHNCILQASCCGMLGIVAFIAYIVYLIKSCLKKNWFAMFVLILIVYYLSHGMIDTLFFNKRIEIILLLMVSQVYKISSKDRVELGDNTFDFIYLF